MKYKVALSLCFFALLTFEIPSNAQSNSEKQKLDGCRTFASGCITEINYLRKKIRKIKQQKQELQDKFLKANSARAYGQNMLQILCRVCKNDLDGSRNSNCLGAGKQISEFAQYWDGDKANVRCW